jgi:hypothetical protein
VAKEGDGWLSMGVGVAKLGRWVEVREIGG